MYPDPKTIAPVATFNVSVTRNLANSAFSILYPVIYWNTGVPDIEWIRNNKSVVLRVTFTTLLVRMLNLEMVVSDIFNVQEKFKVT